MPQHSIRRWGRAAAGIGVVAVLATFAMASTAQAADDVTFTIGKILRVDGDTSNPNAGPAQPQPSGYVSYVTFASTRLADGQQVNPSDVYTIVGDNYISVTLPADATMPSTVSPSAFDASGNPTAFRVGGPTTTEGIWHGGSFPTGSHWTQSGQWVNTAGQSTAWLGGTGGYTGTGAWTAPANGEKITLIDKYYTVDIVKTFDDGSSAANRLFYTTNNPNPFAGSRLFAWKTSADGTTRGLWFAGWESYVWEYLSPADVAAGIKPVSMTSTPDYGKRDAGDPVPCTTLSAAQVSVIKGNPTTPPASQALLATFEAGGQLCGGVLVHSTHPSNDNVVTTVNHVGTPIEDVNEPTISIEADQCVTTDGSIPVPGKTTDAADGSTVVVTGGDEDLTATVKDAAFTVSGIVPDVEYTFTVTSNGQTASVTKAFEVCPVDPTPSPTSPTDTAGSTSPTDTAGPSSSHKAPVGATPTPGQSASGKIAPAASRTATNRLAHTGSNIALAALAALTLTGAGFGLVVLRRRRLTH